MAGFERRDTLVRLVPARAGTSRPLPTLVPAKAGTPTNKVRPSERGPGLRRGEVEHAVAGGGFVTLRPARADKETRPAFPRRDAPTVPRETVMPETTEASARPGGREAPAGGGEEGPSRQWRGVSPTNGAGRNALASRRGRVERAARDAEPRVSAPDEAHRGNQRRERK